MKKILKIIAAILVCLCAAFAALLLFLSATEYRPEEITAVSPEGNASETVKSGDTIRVLTWNIGYGALGSNANFFMDGGKESRARSRESVETCIGGIADTTVSFAPDFALFQEVDTDSTRSWHVDEAQMILDRFAAEGSWDSVFAQNYHSAYLMVPVTQPHGRSNSGILTLSRADIASALRRSLPVASGFKKLLDLDRCYSICRIPVENGRNLVLINVHLSAYGTDAAQGSAQLDMLFADMEKEYAQGNYVICGGDFNHDFTGDSRSFFNDGSQKTYSWCHPFPDDAVPAGFVKCADYAEGMTATTRYTDIPYSEDSFTVILDGFLVSDNVTCTYVQNIDTAYQYTDHNPVVMKFTLAE